MGEKVGKKRTLKKKKQDICCESILHCDFDKFPALESLSHSCQVLYMDYVLQ